MLERFVGRCATDLELATLWDALSQAARRVICDRIEKRFHMRATSTEIARTKHEKAFVAARARLQNACSERGVKVPRLEIKDFAKLFVR
jgi:hypothetical protein